MIEILKQKERNEDPESSENVEVLEVKSDAKSHDDDLDGCLSGDNPDSLDNLEVRRLPTRLLPRSRRQPRA